MVSVMSGLVVILFSVRNIRAGLIFVVLMCLGRRIYEHVGMSLSVQNVSIIMFSRRGARV